MSSEEAVVGPSSSSPTPESAALTEEQASFLAECEEEFANRYTDDDSDYMAVKSVPLAPPPIVHPWYVKPRREFDWKPGRGGWGRRGFGNRWNRDDRDRGNYNRGYDRDRNSYRNHPY